MPRNPNKKRCQIPNCRSWAMHEHSHCRAHLDHQLGPRGAGPPKGNVNALKSGRYAKPLSSAEPERQLGQPWDTNGDGELNSIDNITNHLIVE